MFAIVERNGEINAFKVGRNLAGRLISNIFFVTESNCLELGSTTECYRKTENSMSPVEYVSCRALIVLFLSSICFRNGKISVVCSLIHKFPQTYVFLNLHHSVEINNCICFIIIIITIERFICVSMTCFSSSLPYS